MPAQNAPRKSKRINWVVVLRDVHVYCSLSLCAIFLFYGITGFIGNRPGWFVGEETGEAPREPTYTVSGQTELTESALVPVLSAMFPGVNAHEGYDDDGEEIAVTLLADDVIRDVFVIKEDRAVSVKTWRRLPADLTLEAAAITLWFSARYDGKLDRENIEEDERQLLFSFESVWGSHAVTVDKAKRAYQVHGTENSFAQALIDLHRGKNTGFWQELMMDITALLLVTVAASGALYGFVGKPRRRKRLALVLMGASLVFLVLLILAR